MIDDVKTIFGLNLSALKTWQLFLSFQLVLSYFRNRIVMFLCWLRESKRNVFHLHNIYFFNVSFHCRINIQYVGIYKPSCL